MNESEEFLKKKIRRYFKDLSRGIPKKIPGRISEEIPGEISTGLPRGIFSEESLAEFSGGFLKKS